MKSAMHKASREEAHIPKAREQFSPLLKKEAIVRKGEKTTTNKKALSDFCQCFLR